LADQPGYRCKIKHSNAEYFNQSFNDAAIASMSLGHVELKERVGAAISGLQFSFYSPSPPKP
jgi:hypothetical protein